MEIIIGSDHAGYDLKESIKEVLKEKGINYKDVGPFGEESVDYPDFGHQVGSKVNDGEFERGIVICGSGNGINMTVNKYPNVRAALSWKEEIAKLAREHNNANILTLPARFISKEEAFAILNAFLTTDFEGGRHEKRVNKIALPC